MKLNKPSTVPAIVLNAFGINAEDAVILPVQLGLINNTWKVETTAEAFILQKINGAVFKAPEAIAHNIDEVADYLLQKFPSYTFTRPVKTNNGTSLYKNIEGDFYRVFNFIEGSHTKTSVHTSEQAYEAARQFGRFTALLKDFDTNLLKTTIPSFHDLSFRYQQFIKALENGNPERIKEASALISRIQDYSSIVDHFETIKTDPQFKLRVTHHDTKISNVLFNEEDKGICVIDLDTLMPGYFISDVGDMIRTYICPVTEEEQDNKKIIIRPEIFDAIVNGYLDEMRNELSEKEKDHFFYAGSFMIYMQALRFLTDHLNNDSYYGAAYEGHNFSRASNQLVLLQEFMSLKMNRRKVLP